MAKLLHIVATPKGDESRTLKISNEFLKALKDNKPDIEIDTLNLFETELPSITPLAIKGKFELMAGSELSKEYETSWKGIKIHIERFLKADYYLLSTPMWNFSLPYKLKHYFDVIVQPKYLFRYTESGPEGLAKNKKMLVITSRGGDYTPGTPAHALDHLEPYLKTIFGFVGITNIRFINAQPMDAGGELLQKQKIDMAINIAILLAQDF